MLKLKLEEIKATESFTRFTYINTEKYSSFKRLEIEYLHGEISVMFFNRYGAYINCLDETSFREITQPLIKKVIRLHKTSFQ